MKPVVLKENKTKNLLRLDHSYLATVIKTKEAIHFI